MHAWHGREGEGAALALAALVVVPMLVQRRVDQVRARVEEHADPARTLVVSGVRGGERGVPLLEGLKDQLVLPDDRSDVRLPQRQRPRGAGRGRCPRERASISADVFPAAD